MININKDDFFLIFIAGPTAVGKTDVAIELAQHFNIEITIVLIPEY